MLVQLWCGGELQGTRALHGRAMQHASIITEHQANPLGARAIGEDLDTVEPHRTVVTMVPHLSFDIRAVVVADVGNEGLNLASPGFPTLLLGDTAFGTHGPVNMGDDPPEAWSDHGL